MGLSGIKLHRRTLGSGVATPEILRLAQVDTNNLAAGCGADRAQPAIGGSLPLTSHFVASSTEGWVAVAVAVAGAAGLPAFNAAAYQYLPTGTGDSSGSTATFHVAIPSSVAVGALMLMFFAHPAGNATWTTPPGGWNQLRSDTSGGTPNTVVTMWKIAASGDPGSTVGITASATFAAANALVLAYTGIAATPINASGAATGSATGSGVATTPVITTTVANCLIAGGFCVLANTSFTSITAP
jgi:hypothetical protein